MHKNLFKPVFKPIIAIILLVPLLSGCATTIKYPFTKDLYVSPKPLVCNTIVDTFEDVRPEEEHNGTLKFSNISSCTFTSDKDFKSCVNVQISEMMVEHFKKAQLFTNVELKDVNNDVGQNITEIEKLRTEGFDLVIFGKIKHFYGFQTGTGSASTAALFGLAGILVEALANPKTVGGNVEYGDIRIFDLNTKQILWQGDIGHEFKEKDAFYNGPVAYALQALREANNKLTQKVVEIKLPEKTK